MQVSLPAQYLARRLRTAEDVPQEAQSVIDTLSAMADIAIKAEGSNGRVMLNPLALEIIDIYTDDVGCMGAIQYA